MQNLHHAMNKMSINIQKHYFMNILNQVLYIYISYLSLTPFSFYTEESNNDNLGQLPRMEVNISSFNK